MKIRNASGSPSINRKSRLDTLSSNQDSVSRVFLPPSDALCSWIIMVHSSGVRRKSFTIRKTDSTPRGFQSELLDQSTGSWTLSFLLPFYARSMGKPDATYVKLGDYFEFFFNLLIDYIAAWRNGASLMNNLSSPGCPPNFFNIKNIAPLSDFKTDDVKHKNWQCHFSWRTILNHGK